MRIIRFLVVALGLVGLAACGTPTGPVSSNVSGWSMQDINITFGPEISRTATGTEFSSNFVWEGDGDGNRKKLVIALFEDAMQDIGREAMTGNRAVAMNVEVTRFHALTQASRLLCCGEHNIRANLSVTDAGSGEVLAEGEDIYLGRVALGGIPGLVAVAAGRDQRVRIRESIIRQTRDWLAGEE
ncbi:MAG: DUF6778 family protein [Pseudomonadota bacterium]